MVRSSASMTFAGVRAEQRRKTTDRGGAWGIQMLNRLAISMVACLAATLAVQAADLPPAPAPAYKEPVVVLPAFTWTGLYLGGELGWMQTNPRFAPGAVVSGAPFVASSLPVSDKHGLTYGVLAGYNYQVGQFVVGF